MPCHLKGVETCWWNIWHYVDSQ